MSTLSEPPHADSEDDVRTEDEVGSLEDFIDDNEDEVPTSTKAVPHILKSNILTGKRTRNKLVSLTKRCSQTHLTEK